MNWKEIKESIQNDLLSRNLKNPNIRLNALDNLEILLKNNFPKYIENPSIMFGLIEKDVFKNTLKVYKGNGELNSAESSIINEIYYRV